MKKQVLLASIISAILLSGCGGEDTKDDQVSAEKSVSSSVSSEVVEEKEPLTKKDATALDASLQVNIKYIRKFYTDLMELTSQVDQGTTSLVDVYNYCKSWTETDINANLDGMTDEYSLEYRKSLNSFYYTSKELAKAVMEYANTGTIETASKMQEEMQYFQIYNMDIDEKREAYLISAGYTADEIEPVPEVEE